MTANDNNTTDSVLVCSECGSTDLSYSALGTEAICGSCGWTGAKAACATIRFQHNFVSQEAILHALFTDVRNLMAKDFAVAIGRILLRWGFLTKLEPQQLTRYIVAASKALVTAFIEERRKIEKERTQG